MRNLRKLCVAAVAFCAVPAASFAEINDWDINDWDDDYSFAAPAGSAKRSTSIKKTASSSGRSDGDFGLAPAEPAAVPAETENQGNSFSIAVFYAMAADGYDDSVSDTKIDIAGVMFRYNHEFQIPDSLVGIDLGFFWIFGYGAKDDMAGEGIDGKQTDVMFSVNLGPRFGNDTASFGVGVFCGFDIRHGELEYRSYELSETQTGMMYGAYAELAIAFSDECSLALAYHYLVTSVEFSDELDGLEKDIAYSMISVGLRFSW